MPLQDLVDQARRQQAQEADAQAHEPPPRGCRPLWRPACGGGPAVPWWWSLLTLWRFRSLRAFKRLNYILPRVMTIAMAVFILATLYWGIGDDAGAGSVTSIAAGGRPAAAPDGTAQRSAPHMESDRIAWTEH